jgi:microcystin-dependent protein
MSTPYIGEIRMFGGNFAPANWALCNGQTIPISQNEALFNLIGTTYGGDGVNTFNLPNLQCRLPVHQGTSANGITYTQGQLAGTEAVTLTTAQLPNHTHVAQAATAAASTNPTNGVFGGGPAWFETAAPTLQMNAAMVGLNSGNQPHDNMAPFLVVNFIISLYGIFPSRN